MCTCQHKTDPIIESMFYVNVLYYSVKKIVEPQQIIIKDDFQSILHSLSY